MKTDRELLELAAEAAGIEVVWMESSYHGPTMGRVEVRNGEEEITEPWNPLTDDGDALRLAVKLHMFDAGNFMALRLEETKSNPARTDQEITRRAIVRAAAEIGGTL
jgi:hypothetical protein